MKTNALRLSVGLLVISALILISCGPRAAPAPAATPKPTPAPAVPAPAAPTPTPTPAPAPAAPAPEKPRYGGILNALQTADIQYFDAAKGAAATSQLTDGCFIEYDLAKGPAGTGQNDLQDTVFELELWTGSVAESWKLPEIGTFVFQIRRGVRYGLNPASEASRLVNGREFTADDFVYSVKRNLTEPLSGPATGARDMVKGASVEKTGPWEVTIRTPVDAWRGAWYFFYWSTNLYTREVVQKYGDMNDWRNSVGTGPFMMADFVPGSVATLIRNPNYFLKNPVGPGKGDQLPYIDTLKLLIVPDISTRMAVLRTGMLDWASGVTGEDARGLKKTVPRLNSDQYTTTGPMAIGMRLDKPELPYKDKRVRHALMMATDFNAIVKDLYGGEADILTWPALPSKATEGAYWPFEKLPQNLQALYKYNPERAKQLLAEAGYPNGFKSKVIVQNISTAIDAISAVKAMWAKVGVELEVQPRETAVFTGITRVRSHEDMVFRGVPTNMNNIIFMSSFYGDSQWNSSFVQDPVVDELNREMQKNIIINMPKVKEVFHEKVPYLIDQAWLVPIPQPLIYVVWQPWMKNYHGEIYGCGGGTRDFAKFTWIDRDLKEQMTGRR